MVPDPVSLRLARETWYRYDEVHEALGLLASADWSPSHAERLIRAAHDTGVVGIRSFVRGVLQASSSSRGVVGESTTNSG